MHLTGFRFVIDQLLPVPSLVEKRLSNIQGVVRDLNLPREEVQENLEKLFLDIYIYDKMTRGNKKQVSRILS